MNHKIDYIEFSVLDMEKSKKFFSEAFEWEFTDYSSHYTGIKGEQGEMGGFTLETKINTGGPLVVLHSTNLDESLKKVKAFGGEIVKDIFEFPGGRRFEFKDPNGNILAVWSNLTTD